MNRKHNVVSQNAAQEPSLLILTYRPRSRESLVDHVTTTIFLSWFGPRDFSVQGEPTPFDLIVQFEYRKTLIFEYLRSFEVIF